MPKFSPSFYPELGANCHQQQAAMFPVFCVTDLDNQILISNFPSQKTKWVITKGRTTITTYWDASTAYFQCTVPALDILEDIPPAPGGLFRHAARKDANFGFLNPQAQQEMISIFGADGAVFEEFKASLGTQEGKTFTEKSLAGKVRSTLGEDAVSEETAISFAQSLLRNKDQVKEDVEEKDRKEIQYMVGVEGLNYSILEKALEDARSTQRGKEAAQPGVREESQQQAAEEPSKAVVDPNFDPAQFYLDINEQSAFEYQEIAASEAIQALPLEVNDEICIFMGYLPEMRPITPEDFTENRLLRRGVWVIDTITRSGGASTGVIMTIQCRDRLKYLMDTFGSYNTAESDDILVEDLKNIRTEGDNQQEEGIKNRIVNRRSDVILKIARRGIGQSNNFSVGGRRINAGWIYDPPVESKSAADGRATSEGTYTLDGVTYEYDGKGTYTVVEDGVTTVYTVTNQQGTGQAVYTKTVGGGEAEIIGPEVYNQVRDKYQESARANSASSPSADTPSNTEPKPGDKTPESSANGAANQQNTPSTPPVQQPSSASTGPSKASVWLPSDITTWDGYSVMDSNYRYNSALNHVLYRAAGSSVLTGYEIIYVSDRNSRIGMLRRSRTGITTEFTSSGIFAGYTPEAIEEKIKEYSILYESSIPIK